VTETRELYLTNDPVMNRILQSIADRLDRLEGLRTNPKFYSNTFEFAETLDTGSVLTASDSDEATFDESASSFTGITIIGDDGETIHSMT